MLLDEHRNLELTITHDGLINGLVLWLNLHTDEWTVNDIFQSQQSFLPIYFPVFAEPMNVMRGDILRAQVWRKTSHDSIYPDYGLLGELWRGQQQLSTFRYESKRQPGVFCGSDFYKRVFPQGQWQEKERVTAQVLREYLLERLPEYMVPAQLVEVERLPLTANGKIDKQTLLKLNKEALLKRHYQAPHSEIEVKLAIIWQELLGVEQISTYDNFFDLGGDSIISIQLVSRARKVGLSIQPKDVFLHQSLQALATALTNNQHSLSVSTAEQGRLSGKAGLLPSQLMYLQQPQRQVSHFNQSLLLQIDKRIAAPDLQVVLEVLFLPTRCPSYAISTQTCGWARR